MRFITNPCPPSKKTPEHLSLKPNAFKTTTFVVGPEVAFAADLGVAFVAADPETVSVVAPEVVSASVGIPVSAAALETCSAAVDPKVFSVVALEAGFVAADPKIVSVVDQAEAFAAVAPEVVSVDIAFAFVVLVPASVVVAEADSSECPRFFAFPNDDHFASSSSSAEVAGEEYVHSPICAHASYGLCNILSSQDPHHNRN